MSCPECQHELYIYTTTDYEGNMYYYYICHNCGWKFEYFDSIPELKHYFETHYERKEIKDD